MKYELIHNKTGEVLEVGDTFVYAGNPQCVLMGVDPEKQSICIKEGGNNFSCWVFVGTSKYRFRKKQENVCRRKFVAVKVENPYKGTTGYEVRVPVGSGWQTVCDTWSVIGIGNAKEVAEKIAELLNNQP